MENNKIDNTVKNKFENRTFTPSTSAWERLSVQLDEQPKQKKFGWFFYIGAAASVLLLVSIGIQIFSDNTEEVIPIDEVVITPIDKKNINKQIDKLINEVPVPEAVVKKEVSTEKEILHSPVIAKEEKQYNKKEIVKKINSNKELVLAQVQSKNEEVILKENTAIKNQITSFNKIEQDPNRTIKVNADDLLYAVTHNSEEVKAYYAKYEIKREDVLKTIKNELKKSNIKVNPNTILAEVERNINDDYFENNFMRGLKRRVSDIAVAIASRND